MTSFDNYLFFSDSNYKKNDGVVMGNPLGPNLANIFMGFMERRWLQECPIDLSLYSTAAMLMTLFYFLNLTHIFINSSKLQTS